MKILTNYDFNQNEIQNVAIQRLATAPSTPTPVKGQVYFNTTSNRLFYYNGTNWIGSDANDAVLTGSQIVTAINGSASIIDDDNLSTNVNTAIANSHSSHAISDITNLQTALDGKVDDSQVLTNVPAGAKFTDTVYTHPTTAGNKHIPTGGSTNQILRYSASGTAVWSNEVDTVYTHPTGDGNLHVPATSTTNNGKVLKAGATAGSLVWATDNDTIYTHPAAHPPSIITQDSNNRFVTDAEKTTWNSKSDGTHTHSTYDRATSALTGANVFSDIVVTDGITTALTTRALTAADIGASATNHIHVKADITDLGNLAGISTNASKVNYLRGDGTWVTPPDTVYTHPSTDGSLHVPATGTTNSGKVLKAGATAGSLVWADDNDTTYSVFTSSVNGLTPASGGGTTKYLRADGTWVVPPNTIYTLPVAGASLGGVKSGTDITVDASGNVSVNDDSHNHVISNIDGLSDALDALPTVAEAQGYASTAESNAKSYADTAISNLVGSAPSALDTLNELATALGNDANFATTVTNSLAKKTNKYSTTLGNGTNTSFVVTHNLNSRDVVITIRETGTPYAQVITDVEMTTVNTVTVKFAVAPTSAQYTITIIG